jgi:hypothetical protein
MTKEHLKQQGISTKPLSRLDRSTREGDFAIYEQRWRDSENVCYEVVRIQRCEAQTLFGRQYPAREVYPSSERWGEHGWTVLTKDAAFDKLRELGRQP